MSDKRRPAATGELPELTRNYVNGEWSSGLSRQPLGVFTAITPFNFPAMIPWWFLPYAVATGNTFILKPSERVPLSSQLTFEAVDEVDFPDGVVNLVNGGADTVFYMTGENLRVPLSENAE